jgi:hypothetical protein
MDISSLRALLTPQGQKVLAEAAARQPREQDYLSHLSALSRSYPTELARAALETAILRLEAEGKFPQAGQMFFTREALEQASAFEVSAYRVQRFASFELLLDLGCSIGGDTLGLAALAPTLAFDLDRLRLEMARLNLEALLPGKAAGFQQADISRPLPVRLSTHMGLFFDPARRSQGRRVYSVHAYQPPLDVIRRWLPHAPALGVKLSPGVSLEELHGFEAEVEFISLRGELKEAVLWFGPLKTVPRRAVLLPGPHILEAATGELDPPAELDEPRAFLYEPDPAILRAGLVRKLGSQIGAAQLDPDIAYLTADRLFETCFAKAFKVEEWLPFSLKRLRAALRSRGVEQVIVKKRGSPIQPEALVHDLRLKPGRGGSEAERIVFLTHLRGRPIAIICLPPAG